MNADTKGLGFGGRLMRLTKEGDWFPVEVPTIEQLVKHGRRFGIARIAETAVELGYGLDSMTRLIRELDQVDREEHDKIKKFYHAPKQDAEKRAKRLLNWEEPEAEEAAVAA